MVYSEEQGAEDFEGESLLPPKPNIEDEVGEARQSEEQESEGTEDIVEEHAADTEAKDDGFPTVPQSAKNTRSSAGSRAEKVTAEPPPEYADTPRTLRPRKRNV